MARMVGGDVVLKLLREVGELQEELTQVKRWMAQLDNRTRSRFREVEELIVQGFRNTSDRFHLLDLQLNPWGLALGALAESALHQKKRIEECEERILTLEKQGKP